MFDPSNVSTPIERANGLPNACYIDDAMYQHEQNTLFHNNWAAIGFGKDIAKPGMVKPLTFLGIPMIMLRTPDGSINVFQNVCRHRGMILIDEPQQLRGLISCPYHAWAYDFEGNLRKTPHIGGPNIDTLDSVRHCDYPLNKVRAYVWNDIVFVNISGDAPDFTVQMAGLIERWSEFDQPIYHGGADSSLNFNLACNWKLAVENYCEAYHLPFVHPALNRYSRLEDHYNILDHENYAGQGTTVYAPQVFESGAHFPTFEGLSAKWDAGAEYVALFPNVLLGIHKDHYFNVLLTPDGTGRTIEQIEFYYTDPAVLGDDYADMRATNSRMWCTVFSEDVSVVEGMQKGRKAPAYDGGKFSAVMDEANYHFHKWVARELSM